jgi:cytoskeletal protein RodZ
MWALVGVLALVLAGLLVFWVTRPDDSGRNDASANSSANSSTASSPVNSPAATTSAAPSATTAEATQESSAAPTTESQPTTTSAAAGNPLSAQNIEAFLQSYHQQAVADPRRTYQTRTGPTLRSAISENGYVNYYDQFSRVRIRGIKATDGQTTATGTLEWTYKDGRVESARRLFTLLVRDGHLVLDSETNP